MQPIDSVPINLPEGCEDDAFTCYLLVDERTACIVVLLSARNASHATAYVYDSRSGGLITEETVLGDISKMRDNSRRHVCRRLPTGEVQRLYIDEQELDQ